MGFSMTSKAGKEFLAFRKQLEAIAKGAAYAKVGVVGSAAAASRDGLTNAELAAVHEFGSPAAGIPERSFLRSSFAASRSKYVDILRQQLGQVARGKTTITEALGVLGATGAADVKRGITEGAGIQPPNAPSTVVRKGSDRPLVDTGQLLASISWQVVTGDAASEPIGEGDAGFIGPRRG